MPSIGAVLSLRHPAWTGADCSKNHWRKFRECPWADQGAGV